MVTCRRGIFPGWPRTRPEGHDHQARRAGRGGVPAHRGGVRRRQVRRGDERDAGTRRRHVQEDPQPRPAREARRGPRAAAGRALEAGGEGRQAEDDPVGCRAQDHLDAREEQRAQRS